ncbi:MAG: type II secretion system minor pseudopilin GspH [Gammaproteobacteria bacterium]|nr:type II secretion system minor pseudopilin GspH [Gammaproteobacteria bacterium]
MLALPAGRAAGFTLLELMVVMVLIGIIFSFAMLSMGGDDLAELMEQEARRLETLLSLASDEAVIRGDELAMRFEEGGYEFMVLAADGWRAADDGLLKSYRLPDGIELQLDVSGDLPVLGEQSEQDSTQTPQIFILSSGEMTPFSVTFNSRNSTSQFHLTTTVLGTVSWEVEEVL